MLKTALDFIKEEFNQYVSLKDHINFSAKALAVVSNIVNQNGELAFDTTDTHKVIITLVNVEEERITDVNSIYRDKGDQKIRTNPPICLNAFLLFSSYSDNYTSAVRHLGHVVSFFQAHKVFDSKQFKRLQANVDDDKEWQKVDRISFELYNISFEQQNNLWSTLGAKYIPSVIFKMRVLAFDNQNVQAVLPEVSQVSITSR